MGIIKNAITLGSGFNITAQGPIDSRQVVETVSDLTTVWGDDAPSYKGMQVVVKETGDIYILMNGNSSVMANWKKIGGQIESNLATLTTTVQGIQNNKADKTTTVTGSDGLTGGGNLSSNQTIKHAVPTGATTKTSGLYKVATDKFGHITSATAVQKADITNLGIPSTNTTYTFSGGTNKFTVTPSGGTAQNVTVTPSIANNVVKSSADTTSGYIPKFTDANGTIANGYSVQTTLSSNASAIPTASAVSAAIDSKIATADAMIYKGTIGTGGTVTSVPANGYKVGWTYKVITAGTYAGIKCEIGDMLIAIADGPASGTTVTNAHWTVVQSNIDGAVTGPTSSVASHVATFDGTTGKVIKDSGFTIDKSVPSNAVFTDTTVTDVDHHYKPSKEGDKSADYTSLGTCYDGMPIIADVRVDAAGHITSVKTTGLYLSGLGGISSVHASGRGPLHLTATEDSYGSVTIEGVVETMRGSTGPDSVGSLGLVPTPSMGGDYARFLRGDGTWASPDNTTYKFTNGTNGSFTVTPLNGTAQTVTVGKIPTAGTADKLQNKLTIQFNGSNSTEYDGSAAKTINVTPSSIGALSAINFSSDTINGSVSVANTTATLTANLVWEEF